jgi:hypothetical protein
MPIILNDKEMNCRCLLVCGVCSYMQHVGFEGHGNQQKCSNLTKRKIPKEDPAVEKIS